jgi:hypothetical protein
MESREEQSAGVARGAGRAHAGSSREDSTCSAGAMLCSGGVSGIGAHLGTLDRCL